MAPKAKQTPAEMKASIDSISFMESIEKLRKKIQGREGQREDAEEGEVEWWIQEDEAEISRTELSPIVIDGDGSEAQSDVDDGPVAKRQKGGTTDTTDQGRAPAPVRGRGGRGGRGSTRARGRGRGGATGSATPPVNAVASGSGTTDTPTRTAVPATVSTTGRTASATVAKTRWIANTPSTADSRQKGDA